MKIPSVLSNSADYLGTIESSGFTNETLTGNSIREAFFNPIWPDGSRQTIFDIIRPGGSVCVVVSDHTRQTATSTILPFILEGLIAKGCSLKDIFFLIASGIHRPPNTAETQKILGQSIFNQFEGRIFRHNADDEANLVYVGTTKRGHNVRVNRQAIEADRLILVGTVGYHYHAGFGGGRKSLVPGLASRDTIAYNHSLTLDPVQDRIHPMVDPGILDGNPVAEEMLEGARMCNPDIIINTVLTPSGKLAGVFSGELDLAHRAACRMAERVSRVDINRPADLVIASAGSALNWIQSHKALVNAHRAVKENGLIILIAPCPEGLGDERFRYWVKKNDIAEIYSELRRSSEVLGQTALSSKTRGRNAILMTEMNSMDISDLGIRTAPDLESAVKTAMDDLKQNNTEKPSYFLMPEARHSVPFLPGTDKIS